jgi:hypothetical protein
MRKKPKAKAYLPELVEACTMKHMHQEECSVLHLKLPQTLRRVFSPHAQTEREAYQL